MGSTEDRILERLRCGDEALTKLKLIFPPSETHLIDLLELLPVNSTVVYVLLERRFVNALSSDMYRRILLAIGQMKNLQELEIWSVQVPLSLVCQAIRPTRTLRKLGLGFVGLFDLRSCEYLEGHPSLKQVYLSEFRIAEEHTDYEADPEEVIPNFDSFLRALTTCPALETVELFSSRTDGDPWSPQALAGLVESDSLRCLTLRRLHLSTEHVLALAQALQTHRNQPLRALDLSENYIGDHASVIVARSIVGHANLRTLSLRDSSITGAGVRQLADAWMHDQRTNANNNNDNNTHDGTVVTTAARLEKLNLAGNSIRDQGARALADLLSLRNPPCSLRHLEVTRAGIADDGCIALASAIRDNTTLVSLGLAYNKMKTASYIAFGEALKTNRTLKSIYLQASRMGIGLDGCQVLLDMLQENMVLENISTLLADTLDSERNNYKKMITTLLRLNCAGRQELFRGNPTKFSWVHAISKVTDDLNAVFYLIKAQPSICGG